MGQFVDVAPRARTRVLSLYGLTGHLNDHLPDSDVSSYDAAGLPLTEAFACGRFAPHLEAASRLLPRIYLDVTLDPGALSVTSRSASDSGNGKVPAPAATDTGSDPTAIDPVEAVRFVRLRLLLVGTPRGDAALMLDGECASGSSAEEISDLLAATCFERTSLTVEGDPILDWVTARLGAIGNPRLRFGRDVHQVVYPGGDLLQEILTGSRAHRVSAPVTTVVYRGTIPADDGQRLGVRIPPALNYPGTTVVAHGRGVSVVSGWGEPVENALGIGALVLVCTLGVLQRVRHAAFDALRLNDSTKLASTRDARDLVSELSAQLNELQLDLSFGVETYVDSVLIPDLVVETYQLSLREGMGISEALGNTSRMLERLQSVIQARLSALSAAEQEQTEQRHRIFSLVIAIGSLIALPPALLLAFFGVNAIEVNPEASIFDLGRYWPAYLVAWLPFVILVVAGLLPLRRIRVQSRQLQVHGRRRRSKLQTQASSTEPDVPSTESVPRPRLTPAAVDADTGPLD